jgi:two-component system chemotaxis sensor kinase CheA
VSLLFSSGVSTAKEVTDVSGRGVGMDVVKRAIEEAGGLVSVSTESGKGSVFTVRLPKSVTTQILDGFIVEADSQCYVLPMNRIRETVKVQPKEVTTVTGKGKCIRRHGDILPVVDLREALRLPRTNGGDYSLMVTAEAHNRVFAIVVDGVRGVQQIVVRPLEGLEDSVAMLSGGALLGDGSVALIIDADALSPFAVEAVQE